MTTHRSYAVLTIRLMLLLGLIISLSVLACLVIGAQTPGNTISAFTTTSFQTTNVWVMDVSRMQYVHFQVNGHSNDVPVWSAEERRIIYFPRPQ